MNKIQILMYHQVGDFPSMQTHRATYCDHRRFALQMRYLKMAGYRVMSMRDAVQTLQDGRAVPPKAVVLTFDDAYENFYEYALPHLRAHGFPATVYAISRMLGKNADWLASDGHHAAPLMNAARLRELRQYGIEIGSHSSSHVRLGGLSVARVREEIVRSKMELEDALGSGIDHFCYPYGSHDRQAMEIVAEAGYQSATTCERAPASHDNDLLALPRKAVAWGDSLLGVWWKMHMKNTPKRPLLHR
ncbi:MAG TPA: polysaccharide deacetylase family protein [Oxalicibacterium sp.]|nr:polysaccharide deacetylase family protein [Oxalicibacterium sp.]